jgi:hypothetical protein
MLAVKIIAAALLALLLSAYQYLYKKKSQGLFVLRFFIYWLILLLLLDISYNSRTKNIIKPDLYVVVDQSQSISYNKGDRIVRKILDSLKESSLTEKYSIHYYGFGKEVNKLDSISFNQSATNIFNAINTLSSLYDKKYKAPLILITDGISNEGQVYWQKNSHNNPFVFYPVIIGDTTTYANLSIQEVNVNPVAFRGNKFPVEIFVFYEGKLPVTSKLNIKQHNTIIYSKTIHFKKTGSQRHKILLPAKKLGNQLYQVEIIPFTKEKNTKDNYSNFSIEIINQQKNIAIISSIIHPDIGLIKRQLQKDKYINTDFFLISDAPRDLTSYSSLILYQPDLKFSKLFKDKSISNQNWLIITGKNSSWSWLNNQHLFFSKSTQKTIEDFFPWENKDFSLFKFPQLSFEKYPPLIDYYGKIHYKQGEIALFTKINNIKTQEPLLLFNKNKKQAVLLGQNYWQWGLYASKLGEKENLDHFFMQIIQYISSQKKPSLKLDYKGFYYEGEPIEIRAYILNKNLQPDLKDRPLLFLFNEKNEKIYEAPLLLNKDYYEINLKDLEPGEYHFSVYSKNAEKTRKGSFTISSLNKEQIQNKAAYNKLSLLAKQSEGQLFFPTKIDRLIRNLNHEKKFPSHIKNIEKRNFLIDFKYLLFLLILLLSIEWLIKKINGRI